MVAATSRILDGAREDEGEPYVREVDIKSAVHGNELSILSSLGINWRGGKGHIDCPFPDHGGANDWRWDDKQATAHCTCMKSGSIFDVIMKCEGIDFEKAKLRAAEMLGRSDLIRRKSPNSARFQKTDARSLLNPESGNRDDTLVKAYLAFRLGVDEPPLPSTPIVGIKLLDYFDPPKARTGKPIKVGQYPCAVFGMVGPDGKRHAHRIYLAAGGKGKADLGLTADEKERDPKKSAKIDEGDNCSGRCVIWGKPADATWCIVCEGIETAAAVALAFSDEIVAGELFVASAITANGVQAFRPTDKKLRIVVGADRDEGLKPHGRKPSLRGEEAARGLGLALLSHSVSIALPGAPGTTTDWLNILENEGVDAVRSGILSAEKFEPTADETDKWRRASERTAELAQIASIYPLPELNNADLHYEFTRLDRIMVHKVVIEPDPVTKEKIEKKIAVSSPFGVVARLRYRDHDDAYGLRVVVQDMNGRPRFLDLDRGDLSKAQGGEVREQLLRSGLRVESDGELLTMHCLKAADPEREVEVVSQPGWHELDGNPTGFFVCPDGSIISDRDIGAIELADQRRMPHGVAFGGTMQGWKDAIAAAGAVKGCQHWIIGMVAGLVGPLVAMTGMDSCGVNLSGLTSSGKSTAQRLAVSAWSTPDLRRPGLFQSARATNNATEALAARANATVLAMDELAHINGKEVGRIIHLISGGVGKARMAADSSIRGSYTWSTFAVFSAESSLEEKIRSDGAEWQGGMAVRIADVDVTGINRDVDPKTMAAIGAVEKHFGHAGPAFVRGLIDAGIHREAMQLRAGIDKVATMLAAPKTDAADRRAQVPFALLLTAGQLAQRFGIIPADIDIRAAVQWASERFKTSSDAFALDPKEQALSSLRTWVLLHWGAGLRSTNIEGLVPRETIGWFDENAVYIPKASLREAAGGALKETAIAEILDIEGLIAKRTSVKHRTANWVPKVGKVQVYALTRREFGRKEDHWDHNERPHVVGGGDA